MIPESIYCEFLSKDIDDIDRAVLGRTLTKRTDHNLSEIDLKNIHKLSLETATNYKQKTELKFELIKYHAKKLGKQKLSKEAEAEEDELNAKKHNKAILWEKAAITFYQLKKYDRAANAYVNANNFVNAAKSYHLSNNQTKYS